MDPSLHSKLMGKQWKTVRDFILGGSKITANGACSHEIKKRLLLGRKVMTILDSHIKKQRHYFANKGPSSQSCFFPVVMYGCESWTIKKSGSWRFNAFELCCWRRLLRVPWTTRRSNQFILKEISPEYSLERLMLKLKLSILWLPYAKKLTHWKRPWYLEWLKVGEEGDDRGWDVWMTSLTQWTWVWVSSRS